MKHEAMMDMSKTDLDEYGKALGIDVTGKKTVAAKVEAIEEQRGRTAEIDILGITVTIPIKRFHDKRVSDIYAKSPMTDDDANALFVMILGEKQAAKVAEQATDEDGTVDVDAMGYALAKLLTSEQLKNF